MKRPALVIASAVVLILLSLLQILTSLLMVLAGTAEHTRGLPVRPGAPPTPAWMPLLSYGMAAVFAGLAVWGILTAIGIFRLRRWARTSILIIGGCVATVGVMALVGTVIAMATFSSFAPAGATPLPAMMKAVFAVFGLFYAAVAAVGIFWLVYFNRKTVRAGFAGIPEGAGPVAASGRPVLISIYAVLSLFSALSILAMAFLPLPTVLYGVAFLGWKKVVIDLLFASLNAAIGIGLWKMAEWARRLALGYLAFGGGMITLYLVRPSLIMRNSDAFAHAMGVTPAPLPGHSQTFMYGFIFGFSFLFMIAIAWMLHYYRGRFAPPAPAASIAGV